MTNERVYLSLTRRQFARWYDGPEGTAALTPKGVEPMEIVIRISEEALVQIVIALLQLLLR